MSREHRRSRATLTTRGADRGLRAAAVESALWLAAALAFGGVLGALVLRGAFIAAGGALIEHVSWILYVFGALVLLAGARTFSPGGAGPGGNLAVRGLRRVLPVTEHYDGGRFFTRARGRAMATPLLVALVAVAVTDVVFALDSIPAVFGVTRDLFVVFTANVSPVVHLPTWVSLVVLVVVAGGAVAASRWRDRTRGHRGQQARGEPVRT